MSANAELLLLLAEHLLLTALPGALAVALAMRRGLASVPLLLALFLAASGATAILAFWAFYADPVLGETFSFVVAGGAIGGIAWAWRDGLDRGLLRQLATPLGLWALGSAFVLFFGFLHGGTEEPLLTAANRFSHPLPGDNDIPRFFSDWFFLHGHDGPPPPYADWLSSDRPPLQVGYVLSQRPFGWDGAGLHYQAIGVVVQSLWLVGMWALLCAARVRPSARGLAICAAMVGDVAILHGFFVWPKLIAAAFLLAALAIVLDRDWRRRREDPRVAVLFAALCALALLAHGSSAFFLVPLLACGALRGLPGWRWIGAAALAGLVLLAPWAAYQRYADPPGDRLVKWQLGGSLEIDDRGALETLLDSYDEVGLGGALQNKWENAREIAGVEETRQALDTAADELSAGNPGKAAAALRLPRFFNLLPLLGLFLLALPAMAVARVRGRPEGPEWSFALAALALAASATVLWALLMFGAPESTAMVHVGTLAVPLLAVAGLVAGAYACSPRFAAALVAVNAVAVLVLYAPSLSPPPGTSYSALAALLAAAALAGFLALAFRGDPALRR